MMLKNGGGVTLYNGDNSEVIDTLINEGVKVDKIITSPPYNIIRPNSTDRGYDEYKDGMSNEEYFDWLVGLVNKIDIILNENGCILLNISYGTENPNVMNLLIAEIIKRTDFTIADVLVWKKKSATPNNVSHNKMTRIVEFIYVLCRESEYDTFTSNKKKVGVREDTNQAIYENVFNFFTSANNDYSTDLNKATFSTSMVQNLIDRYVLKTDIVLDPFSGTGTTCYACERNNIKSIGIELSKAQHKHASDRISEGVQINLF